MKSRPLLLLFCLLALVHLAAQSAMLYAWLEVVDQDAVHYDALRDINYSRYLAILTFPGSHLFAVLSGPPSLVVARTLIVTGFVLNSVLWSGLICTALWMCARFFRAYRPHGG